MMSDGDEENAFLSLTVRAPGKGGVGGGGAKKANDTEKHVSNPSKSQKPVDVIENKHEREGRAASHNDDHDGDDDDRALTGTEIWNLTFCLLSWVCTLSNVAVVVGLSGNVISYMNGGSTRFKTMPLGVFFWGASISCGFLKEPFFQRVGYKHAFLTGIASTLVANGLGALGLVIHSPSLNIVGTLIYGVANQFAMKLPVAAEEHLPKAWAARAVTMMRLGGIMAAFAGPQLANYTDGIFSKDADLYYMGVYLTAGGFNVANLICIAAVKFAPPAEIKQYSAVKSSLESSSLVSFVSMYKSLLKSRSFLFPMLIAALSWSIMSAPMGLLRAAMKDASYTSRQSLTALEVHFCGMYALGFFGIGNFFIQRYGGRAVCGAGFVVSCMALTLNLMCDETKEQGRVATWYAGMIGLGFGWNFGFTGAAAWSTTTHTLPNNDVGASYYTKVQVQSANDCLMYLIAGVWIFCAGFIYDARFGVNGVLRGWKRVNYYSFCLCAAYFLVMLTDYYWEGQQQRRHSKDEPDGEIFSPDIPMNFADAELRVCPGDEGLQEYPSTPSTSDSTEISFAR